MECAFVDCARLRSGLSRDRRTGKLRGSIRVTENERDEVDRIAPRPTGKRKVNMRARPQIFGFVDVRVVR